MPLENLVSLKTELRKSGEESVLVIHFSGKITADNVLDLNQKIRSIFSDKIYRVVLNISELEYMNSSGITLFLTIAKTIDQNKGKLVLTKPTPFVKDLFEMTDLISRFTIAEDLESACKLAQS
ncbi:MAG: STAS domain-containing protein [Leptospiraceae bacterium]|nr:STAS domain-containing protein [Leptospiraceae bacterium]MDW8307466.1 STAS domain-containing protein [Leptospiraceae bacterium]